ncbi:glycerol-3-phosphate dehydrogenase [Vibrio sp. 404]|uniref:Glycerol-3-phosphate dehydrogenase n=1 Tax=Vibrio marinisediminis TaxID=2758441 RepID=A0A7W2FTH2_9VIBR|nr:glycerol-3-phosphate dehydrogenase [Vibrio marinisediminis]MBA5763968.1 glycerol-3-phosphate dehydrogenase [Vibrio marinisediminis]
MSNTLEFPLESAPLDVVVIGGGINGAGIASEAVNRGLSVGLYEAKDFAMATSSASSKLIHGGLRYLEHAEFRLVKEALAEREILLRKAAHIVKPMRFRLPKQPALRPAWLIRTGLFLYDHLSRRSLLPPSQSITLSTKDGLKPHISAAFEYSDCWVDDARLVIANVKNAYQMGAEVRNYCEVLHVKRDKSLWQIELFDQRTQQKVIRYSRALVNATGPWAADFIEQRTDEHSQYPMRLVKGSHLIVNKLYAGRDAYILQNADKRVVFVIPYLDQYSMIGTTDIPFVGDPYQVQASNEEISYLLEVCNQHFCQQLSPNDVVDSFSGVRPLFGTPDLPAQQQSRDYELVLQAHHLQLPIVSLYGGKLTTYRKLAEKTVDKLQPYFDHLQPSQSEHHVFSEACGLHHATLEKQVHGQHPYLSKDAIRRMVNLYGVEIWQILSNMSQHNQPFVDELYMSELDFLKNSEWAMTADDILKRRTKLCYQLTEQDQQAIYHWLS